MLEETSYILVHEQFATMADNTPEMKNVHTGESASGTAKVNGEDKAAPKECIRW